MTNYQYAGFWRRAMAYFVDSMLLFCVSLALLFSGWMAFLLGSPAGGRALMQHMKQFAPFFMLLYYLALMFFNMIYFTYFHGNTGQTPGKMLLGIQVLQANGERVTYGIAFLRWVGYIVSQLFLYLGFLWIGVDQNKRGWHDYIAGTVVIRLFNSPECTRKSDSGKDEMDAAAVEAHGS